MLRYTSTPAYGEDPLTSPLRDDRVVRKGKEIERLYRTKVCNPVEFTEEEKWQQRLKK
jgi:hypothetical protein